MFLFKEIKKFATVIDSGMQGGCQMTINSFRYNDSPETRNSDAIPHLGIVDVTVVFMEEGVCTMQVFNPETGKAFSCFAPSNTNGTFYNSEVFGGKSSNGFLDIDMGLIARAAHNAQNEALNKARRKDYDPCGNLPVAVN